MVTIYLMNNEKDSDRLKNKPIFGETTFFSSPIVHANLSLLTVPTVTVLDTGKGVETRLN